jgi:hypothetical protein
MILRELLFSLLKERKEIHTSSIRMVIKAKGLQKAAFVID